MIGRRYAHVIWVACQGEAVRGYAFVKDHKILEIATDPAHPQALAALLGRVRAEALERAYPEVIVHAPADHPVHRGVPPASGRIIDQEEYEGTSSMYHIPDVGPVPQGDPARADPAGRRSRASRLPLELGLTVGDRRWLLHVEAKQLAGRARQAQPPAPDAHARRRSSAWLMGHTGIDARRRRGRVRGLDRHRHRRRPHPLPGPPIWRSPLDAATA